MKVYVNESCIGCGLCASTCPEVFQMMEQNVAEASEGAVPPREEGRALEALENCPVSAIERKEEA